MKNIFCLNCKKVFTPREEKTKFCSRKCYYETKKLRGDRVNWTKEMRERMSKKYIGSGNPMFGKDSWSKGKKRPEITGKLHPNYKGGWIEQGYKTIHALGRQIKEHRLLMEHYLGRELTKDEILHHVNGDKLDNRIENLQVVTRSEHINIHRVDLEKGKLKTIS